MSKPLHIIRRQRRKRPREEIKSELDMTSMIDVVFLLLIFFMVATKFKQPEGTLRSWLPRDRGTSGGAPVVNPGCRFTLQMSDNIVVCYADQTTLPLHNGVYGSDDLGQAQQDFEGEWEVYGPDLQALERHIQMRKDTYMGVAAKGLPVIIDFAKDVPSVFVVNIVDLCKKLEIDDVAFAAPEIPIED